MMRNLTMILGLWTTLTTSAGAAPVIYELKGTGSGSVNGVDFTRAGFTFTFYGDTDNAFAPLPGLSLNTIETQAATLKIAGFELASIVTDTLIFANQEFAAVGISRENPGSDIFNANSPSFGTYDLTTTLDLTPSTSIELMNSQGAFDTSLGSIAFSRYLADSTFSAQVIPVPASLLLMASGLAVVGVTRRKGPADNQRVADHA
jgi:hypothetical protein